MLFSSLTFLLIFLPVIWLLYELTPVRQRNLLLLLASFLFYAWGDLFSLPLLFFLIVSVYFLAPLLVDGGRVLTFFVFSVPVFFLVCMKFLPLVFSANVTLPLHVPLGVSFYTFQAVSYLADVRRKAVLPQKSFLRLSLYISLFPQILAGPIVPYASLNKEFSERKSDRARGLERFIFGLSKKLLLADPFGILFGEYASVEDAGCLLALLCLLCFSFQIYFDFSGYSDMAIGIALLFGFHYPENFRYPYTATSVKDFWSRWHISLTGFFRNYIYIPLGGNRGSIFKTVRNTVIVWALTGLWHGVTLNFILWGLYWCTLLLTEKLVIRKLFANMIHHVPSFLCHVLTLILIAFGWILFAFDTPAALGAFLRELFSTSISAGTLYEWLHLAPLLLVAVLFCTPLPNRRFESIKKRHPAAPLAVCLPLLLLCISALADASYQPFLYLQF